MQKIKINSSKAFFTSDLHLFHAKIIEYCNRPVANVNEMHDLIIRNWNNTVPEDATVFIQGDASWKGKDACEPIINQLNGNKIFIIGNHDSPSIFPLFTSYHDMLLVEIYDEEDEVNVLAHLTHYPLVEWFGSQKGNLHFHGHLHSTDENRITGKNRIDIGMDGNNLTPYSYNNLKSILKNN